MKPESCLASHDSIPGAVSDSGGIPQIEANYWFVLSDVNFLPL